MEGKNGMKPDGQFWHSSLFGSTMYWPFPQGLQCWMSAENIPEEVPDDEFTSWVPLGQLTNLYIPPEATQELPGIDGMKEAPLGQLAPEHCNQ